MREEIDVLTDQTVRHLHARARVHGPVESARKAVTKVLRTQILKLLDLHPDLGEHLRASLRMGRMCTYAPRTETLWDVSTE